MEIEPNFSPVFCPDCLSKLSPGFLHKLVDEKEKFRNADQAGSYIPFIQFKVCYNHHGNVHITTTTPAQTTTSPYKQDLEFQQDQLDAQCSCSTGTYCKHIYAVLFSLMTQKSNLRRGSVSQSIYHISNSLLQEEKEIESELNKNPLTPIEFERDILPIMKEHEMRNLLAYLVVQCPDTCKYIQMYHQEVPDFLISTKPYRIHIEKAFIDHTWFNYDIHFTGKESNFKETFTKLMEELTKVKTKANSFVIKDPMNAYILFMVMNEEITEDRFIGNGEEEYLVQTDQHVQFLEEIREQTEFVETLLTKEQMEQCVNHMKKETLRPTEK